MSQKEWDEILQYKEAILKDECFVDLWHIEDIKEIALDYNHNGDMATGVDYALSTAQAKKVLTRMKAYYDPNFGTYNMSIFSDIEHVIEQAEENSDE
jgi:hypothetical protein